MTVAELIEMLGEYPRDYKVEFSAPDPSSPNYEIDYEFKRIDKYDSLGGIVNITLT